MTLEKLVEKGLINSSHRLYGQLFDAQDLAREYAEAGANHLSIYCDGSQALFIEVIESQGFELKRTESTTSGVWMLFEREFGK